MFTILDLIRLLAAFAAIYLVLPFLAMRKSHGGAADRLAFGFVSATFCLQVSAMVLGDWKLYLPGAAVAVYLVWLGSAALFAGRRRGGSLGASLPSPGQPAARFFEWLERRAPMCQPWLAVQRERFAASPVVCAVALAAAVVGLRAVWFALHHIRLQRLESYSRTISLHSLMRGDAWDHDPSVALLAPLAWLSGLAPDHVIRLSGAVVSVALVLAVAFAALRRVGDRLAAAAASALFAALLILTNLIPSEPGGAEWSAIFILATFGLAGRNWGGAAIAILTAALIHLGFSPVLVLAALALTLTSLFASLWRRLPVLASLLPAAGALALLAIAIAAPHRAAFPEHQYEAAARAAHRIAAEFRTNDWIVVSPGLEVAQTYGRGWHFELADFVNKHSERQLADPSFRMPYSAKALFIFVEKRVLDQPAFSFAYNGGAAPYYYTTRMGRASLQFRAAQLMAAYTSSHRDASVYYQDEALIVYRIDQPEPASLTARAR